MLIKSTEESKWLANYENNLLFRLAVAYFEARRGGKRGTYDEHRFEVYDWENLVILRDAILNKTYHPSRSTAHIIFNPVIREIFAAPFIDRVAQHVVYDSVYDFCDRQFIYDSYSCREGKGTDFGIRRLQHHINSVYNNGATKVWVIKLDVQGYFVNIPRVELLEIALDFLDRQYEGNSESEDYEVLKFLWREIIMDDPVAGAKLKGWPDDWKDLPKTKSLIWQMVGIGIVIGNLTSQLLSNIYLNLLDRFLTMDLKWKHYGRYVDDFFGVFSDEEVERAIEQIPLIADFLARLGLKLHPRKIWIQPAERGVPFLGAVVRPGRRVYPGERLIKNSRRAFSETALGVRDVESVVSYIGHMKHMNSRKLVLEMMMKHGKRMNGDDFLEIMRVLEKR